MAAKKKKNIMRHFKIDEISAVDVPAQAGARMTIMKRHDSDTVPVYKTVWMTEDFDGHSHLVLSAGDSGGFTSLNGRSIDDWHTHPWIMSEEGVPIIGAENGHKHTVLEGTRKMLLKHEQIERLFSEDVNVSKGAQDELKTQIKSGIAMDDGSLPIESGEDITVLLKNYSEWGDNPDVIRHIRKRAKELEVDLPTEGEVAAVLNKEKNTMSKEDENPDLETLTKRVEDAEQKADQTAKELETAKAYGELTDAEKEHYKALGVDDAAGFLEKSADERKSEVEKAQSEAAKKDKVVYKAEDGTEYRESDDPRLVKQAKENDRMAKQLADSEAERKQATYTKRANEEVAHLPGETDTKVELLKAVDSIEDETKRDGAMEILKASNTEMAKAFEEAGTQSDPAAKSASEELDKKVQKYAADHEVKPEQAYVEVLKTDEGRSLYDQTLAK